ncbi:MAG TPA: ABC-type transport auxiliary lipoprotein family protein, partial [Syntrophales bacterium]|nr:ABC-type transport auxiliary lipoprotein family protein [Syntrophales bacterium]
ADYRVQVDIQRLDMTPGKGVALDALWSVRRSGESTAKTGRSVISEPASAGGYDALVAAQSGALAALSRDLAQALRAVSAAPR